MVTKTASRIAIYVNGALEASKPTPSFTDTNSGQLWIGAPSEESQYVLRGRMDEVRILNRALSEGEIRDGYGRARRYVGCAP